MQNKEHKTGIVDHLKEARMEQAEVFTQKAANYKLYVNNYQGVKLSSSSMKALKRG